MRLRITMVGMLICLLVMTGSALADDKRDIASIYVKLAKAMYANDVNGIMATRTQDFSYLGPGKAIKGDQRTGERLPVFDQKSGLAYKDKITIVTCDVKGKTATVVLSEKCILYGSGKATGFAWITRSKEVLVKAADGWLRRSCNILSSIATVGGKPWDDNKGVRVANKPLGSPAGTGRSVSLNPKSAKGLEVSYSPMAHSSPTTPAVEYSSGETAIRVHWLGKNETPWSLNYLSKDGNKYQCFVILTRVGPNAAAICPLPGKYREDWASNDVYLSMQGVGFEVETEYESFVRAFGQEPKLTVREGEIADITPPVGELRVIGFGSTGALLKGEGAKFERSGGVIMSGGNVIDLPPGKFVVTIGEQKITVEVRAGEVATIYK